MTMQVTTSETTPQRATGNVDDVEYAESLVRFQNSFSERTANAALFTTDAEGLWDAYLGAFPAADRQFHSCNSCRRFVETYGALVTIAEDGSATPAMWDTDDVQGDELAAFAVDVGSAE